MAKSKNLILLSLLLIITILIGIFLYNKYSYTEEMARNFATRFFNILMITNSNKEFEDVYPTFGTGSRVVAPALFKINNITKRSDGNFDVYANNESNDNQNVQIYLIINRKGEIVNSRGVSYAHYDKTFDYAKKIGCITGSEYDSEIEKVINDKKLRSKLDALVQLELISLKKDIKMSGRISREYGMTSGTVVVTNNTPYSLSFNDIKCYVHFLSSDGTIVDTEEIFFTNLRPYESTSSSIFSSAPNSSRYEFVKEFQSSVNFKNKIKEYLIRNTYETCQ